MSHGSDSVKSIFFALGANSAIAVAKFAAAIFTGSGAMMAEAIHSTADSSNQLLLLLGLKQAKKPPSADYPLGHGKEVYFWSFIVALIQAINRTEAAMRQAFPQILWLFFEPDMDD